MKKIVYIVLFYVVLAHPALAQPAELNGIIRFAWGDEFNGTTINENMWKVVDNSDNYSDGNGGVAVARNVSVSGGYLNCKVVRETYYCPPNYVDSHFCMRQLVQHGIPYNFTYGRVDSKQKYNHQYGYAEASMHFSNQPGLWPAFWTTIGEGVGPRFNAAEIDIMERVFESNDAKTVTTNVHLGYCPAGTGLSCEFDLGEYCATSLGCYGKKHTLTNECWNSTKYAVYWSPTELIFYINDVRVRRMDNPGVVDIVKFILGMGVATKYVNSTTILPSTLSVDYIHVYDLYECLTNPILFIGQTFEDNNGTANILAACVKVDGNGTTGGKMNLVATKSIAMLPSFSVKEGGYLEARISNVGKVQNTAEELPTKYYPIHMQGQSNTNTVVASEQAATEELFTVSPNPIVYTASIKYSIAKQAGVKITVYNIMGIVEDELINESQLAGEHTYELNATNYKAGVYLLVFESGGSTQKKTVVITK